MHLQTYADFLACLEEKGVIWFSPSCPAGLPSFGHLTIENQWHTNDPETDPWQWKDRAALEQRAAVGNVLGGHKGFIAPRMYPLFYAASRPMRPFEERYEDGLVPRMQQRVYGAFSPGERLSTFELRERVIGPKKEEMSKLFNALEALMRDFYLTVCGSKRKVNALGEPYGWPAVDYARAEDWHGEWLANAALLPQAEAREAIVEHCLRIGATVDADTLRKELWRRASKA